MGLKAVFFDLDDTLYTSFQAGDAYAYEKLEEWAISTFGDKGKGFADAFRVNRKRLARQQPAMPPTHDRVLFAQGALERMGLNAVRYSREAFRVYWDAVFAKMTLRPGVAEFLDELRAAGVKVAICTNMLADIQMEKLEPRVSRSVNQDEYDDETLRENIFMFPSTYSTAGPNAAYEFFVKAYSTDIVSVNVVQNNETAEVDIYIMLADGKIPDEKYCKAVADYIAGLENTPADDKIYVKAPEVIRYKILGKYYISESNRENETIIKESVIEAAQYFVSECHENIGVDIVPDKLIEVARVAGAKRLEITSPVFTQVTETQIAICDSVELVYGGLEDD